MVLNQVKVDPMAGQAIQGAIVGLRVTTPKACFSDVGQTRTELITQQPETSEHEVRVGGRVRHDLHRVEGGLLLEQTFQNVYGVSDGSRNDNAV